MATTVGQHSVAAFTSPVNGTTPIDANSVRGNDNTVRSAYVDHDADPGIHVQSSTLASRPAAGTAGRKWITEDSGVYTLWFDDGTNWHPVSSENINLTVLATETLVKGDVVKVTGWNNGQDLPEVAKVSSTSDTAFAIITANVANGAMGYATNTGIVQDLATNGFSFGATLYPNTSGGFTATKPTSGTYQPCAYVLRSNANNGVLYVEFSAPRIVESSSNTASTVVQRDASGNFSAGTITAGALTASGAVSAGSVTSTGLVTFASLKGTGATTVTDILNDSTMATASATTLATSASIKTYVDNKVATVDTLAEVLANGNTTGANDIIVNAGQKIRTPLVAAQDGTSAITIANSTGALTLNTALADSNLATISTAGKVSNSATTAASANTASAIVARDASGNFTAGTITATLSGTATQVSQALTAGTYLTSGGTYNGSTARTFAVDATDANTASKVVARDASGNFAAGTITATLNGAAPAGSLSGSTLASGVTASSLTSVGTLTSLTVSGAITGATSTNTINGLVINSGGLGGATGIKFGIGAAFSSGQAEAYTTSTTPMGIGTVGAQPLRFYTNSALVAAFDATGNLAVDTNTLYVDAANNRVGVGTASPQVAFTVSNNGSAAHAVRLYDTGANASYLALTASNTDTALIASGTSAVPMDFYTGGSVRMRLDASGNLGLGVTPSAWLSAYKVFQNQGGSFASSATSNVQVTQNAYLNASTQWIYTNSTYASQYSQTLGQHQWYTAASGTAGNAITFTQAMTLDASGNLGVGTTSPQSTIDAYRSTNGAYFRGGSGDPGRQLKFSSSTTTNAGDTHTIDAQSGTGILAFAVTSTERARITSGGYFKASNDGTYYGSTSSYHELRTSGAAGDWTVTVTNATSTAASCYGIQVIYPAASPNGTGNAFLTMGDSTTTRAAFRSNGGLANYQANNVDLSDARTKSDITPLDSMWDKVAALEIVSYKYLDQTHDDVSLGVIAQQVETVEPVWVDSDGFGDTPEGEEPLKTVYNKDITFAAIKALQEAMARIEALEASNAGLLARLEALEA